MVYSPPALSLLTVLSLHQDRVPKVIWLHLALVCGVRAADLRVPREAQKPYFGGKTLLDCVLSGGRATARAVQSCFLVVSVDSRWVRQWGRRGRARPQPGPRLVAPGASCLSF